MDLFRQGIDIIVEEILNFIKNKLKNTGYYDKIDSIILCGDGLLSFYDLSQKTNIVLGKKYIYFNKKVIRLTKFLIY